MIIIYAALVAIIAFVILRIITIKQITQMPILSITEQPSIGALRAAQRPIVFLIEATRTDNHAEPPIVFCDVYVRGVYHKTVANTQYSEKLSGSTLWRFNIGDAVSDIFKAEAGPNGGANVIYQDEGFAQVFCKFRSSGFDINGFVLSEGTAPKQGTGKNQPVAGTGTQSNSFYVVNATLQHTNNQDLASHLNHYKTGAWATGVFPLSHRSSASYKVCQNDSDFFPVLNISEGEISCLRLKYKYKGESAEQTIMSCGGCVPVTVSGSLPSATVGSPYNQTLNILGTSPYNLSSVTKPAWMTVVVDGANLRFTGTPGVEDTPSGSFSFTFTNDCGSFTGSRTITVNPDASCTPAQFVGTPALPDGTVGVSYSAVFEVSGTAPFTISDVVKPTWMTISVTGNNIVFSGTPDVDGVSIPVSFWVLNCDTDELRFNGSVNVAADPEFQCEDWYNNTGNTLYGISWKDCNGTQHTNEDILPGEGPCAQPGTLSGGDWAYLTKLGNC